MLPCENRPPLSREEVTRALPLFLRDYDLFVNYLLRCDDIAPTSSVIALCDCILRYEVPPLAILNRCVGFVLSDLQRKEQSQLLSQEQQEIFAAAWRLSDAMHGPRNTH